MDTRLFNVYKRYEEVRESCVFWYEEDIAREPGEFSSS